MSGIHAIILGALQGVTELFPISSLGHSVLLPHLLNWHVDESANSFLIFLVGTHLATSLVLFGFFWNDWKQITFGMLRSLKEREITTENVYGKLGWLLVVGTIPAGVLGLLFEEKLKMLFASPIPVSIALALNGLLLLGVERLAKKRREPHDATVSVTRIAHLSWWQSIKIGIWQCLALIPGFSRTGSTLGGSLAEGLSHRDAAHFSFLLATPIIFAAAMLELPGLAGTYSSGDTYALLVGSACAAIAAYFSVRFLSIYFKKKTLTPFGIYCIAAGVISLLYFVH